MRGYISYCCHSMEYIRDDAKWYKRMLSSNAWSMKGADRKVKSCRGYTRLILLVQGRQNRPGRPDNCRTNIFLLLVMPATNATSERLFWVLRRLKSYLQSTTSRPRLNHVMVLSIYKELLDELDLYAVANEFVGSSEYRLRLFGTFTV